MKRTASQVAARRSLPTNRAHAGNGKAHREELMDNSFHNLDTVYAPSVIVLTRIGHPAQELRVLVKQGTARWWIDPQQEVAGAIMNNLLPARAGCILSFAEGLVAAGQTVIMQERRRGKHWSDYSFQKSSFIDFAYFLFGLAWGKAQWEQVRERLQTTVVPSQRLAVLAETGKYYDTHRWERPIALRVPVT
ncbi:hypothetical protein HZA87_01515 [Candidatus Uhrbacteria bacterium]|nr:hypothetical protein [Candidatus Uhrbacteria bacterium]